MSGIGKVQKEKNSHDHRQSRWLDNVNRSKRLTLPGLLTLSANMNPQKSHPLFRHSDESRNPLPSIITMLWMPDQVRHDDPGTFFKRIRGNWFYPTTGAFSYSRNCQTLGVHRQSRWFTLD